MKTLFSAIAFASLSVSGVAMAGQSDAPLAAESISKGENLRAIAMLEEQLDEHPGDPALLINLGIAHAQRGEDRQANDYFEAAMHSRYAIDLETADGSLIDSRRLARRAQAMLERGEFRPERSPRNLTLRQ